MRPPRALGSDRLAKALPLLAALAGVALVGSQAYAWWSVNRAARIADRGEAELMVEALHQSLRARRGPPQEADLQAFLEEHRERGLHYVAVVHPHGRQEVGDGQLPDPRPPDRFAIRDGRVRASVDAPPPGHGFGPPPFGPPPGAFGKRPPHPPPGRRPIPQLVVELEPRSGAALRADALRSLIAAAIGALLFVLLALALRRAITAREEAARQAERDRRLAVIGEMSAVLAHEINNPLASLKGHAQLLVELLDEGKPRDKAARVVDEAERLEELTKNLLAFVRSGEPVYEDCDLTTLVHGAADAVDGERFEVEAPDAASARVDPARMRQALINLMDNAAQASEQPVNVRLEARNDTVIITVRDRGPGVAPGDEETIFDPFHTTRVRGTGLGLPIARRIAEGHRGSLVHERPPDGGAAFVLSIPRGGA